MAHPEGERKKKKSGCGDLEFRPCTPRLVPVTPLSAAHELPRSVLASLTPTFLQYGIDSAPRPTRRRSQQQGQSLGSRARVLSFTPTAQILRPPLSVLSHEMVFAPQTTGLEREAPDCRGQGGRVHLLLSRCLPPIRVAESLAGVAFACEEAQKFLLFLQVSRDGAQRRGWEGLIFSNRKLCFL